MGTGRACALLGGFIHLRVRWAAVPRNPSRTALNLRVRNPSDWQLGRDICSALRANFLRTFFRRSHFQPPPPLTIATTTAPSRFSHFQSAKMPQFFGLEVPKGEVSARVPPARGPSPSERAVIYRPRRATTRCLSRGSLEAAAGCLPSSRVPPRAPPRRTRSRVSGVILDPSVTHAPSTPPPTRRVPR